jgi:hypothetical protein
VEKSSLNPPEVLKRCIEQLEEYFLGKRKNFDIPILFDGNLWGIEMLRELLEMQMARILYLLLSLAIE